MEEALLDPTKIHLLKEKENGSISIREIANVIYSAGVEVDHGSVEPVDDYVKRKLL